MKKLLKDELGLAHVLIAVLIVAVLAVVGLVGWKVMNNSKNTSNTTNNSASSGGSASTGSSAGVDSACLATYHDTNLCHFAASNTTDLSKVNYTANLTITQPGSGTSTMTLGNDGKGNTSLMGTGNGATFNSVELNGATYVESGTSGWIEYTSGASSAPTTTDPTSDMNLGVDSTGITYKSLGKSACGSLTCYEYQVTDAAMPDTTQDVWFDTSSYKLREWKAVSTTSGTTDMTVTYGNANITAPSPVTQTISY